MRRRSRKVALSIVGATAFTLAGCAENERVEAHAFPDLESCLAATGEASLFSEEECRTSIAAAQTLHVESAPRYDSLTVCEEQHGAGACGSEQTAAQGGSGGIFMPLLAGYLIGNMMRGTGGMAASQPLYRTSGGRFATPSGTTYSGNSGRGQLGASQFARPPVTQGRAPMTRAMVASRGGFGQSGTSRASRGG